LVSHYVPAQGDLVWLEFGQAQGHETLGRRPAFVISPESYNDKVGILIAFPVTSKAKGYPFEVPLPEDTSTSGVILADQPATLDWRARRAEFIDHAPDGIFQKVMTKFLNLVEG
jgi:mRNA interferase MazF